VYLGLAAAGLGAAYHHWYLHVYPDDDIGHFTTPEPQLVRVRGVLDEEPTIWKAQPAGPLDSLPHSDSTMAILRPTALCLEGEWQPVSGRIRLIIPGALSRVHVNDEIEVVGWLEKPQEPWNPGEMDRAAQLRDQCIRAVLRVRQSPEAVNRLAVRWHGTPGGWLVAMRGWCQQQLKEAVPEHAGLAIALLLGDSTDMSQADWQKYLRTGVVHALAISGQHLVVLAGFFWWMLRLAGVRSRRGALLIALILVGYTFLVSGRPPVVRAAVIVCVACVAILLRRPVLGAN